MKKVDYIIIYGNHKKEKLNKRLDYFLMVKDNYDYNKIVLTGGIGLYGNYNESLYMKDYLINKGINEKDIIVEDKSSTTKQNNKNVIELLKLNEIEADIVLISNKFHMNRIKRLFNRILKNNKINFYYDIVK